MDERKKSLMKYLGFGLFAFYFFGIGYSIGKSKSLFRMFAFTVPEHFSSDDVQYFLAEVKQTLRSHNYEVTDEELKQIAFETAMKTEESRNMVNELFQTLGE